jgi:CDP-diacylglycerol--glycerol-3-phosphate 3-phosphatidyltransferase
MNPDRAARALLGPVATRLAHPFRRAHPVALTIASGLLGISGALLVALGEPLGAVVAVVGVCLDAIDGPVARLTGRESRFGAWLDSTVDRAVDFALLAALGYRGHLDNDSALIAAALAAALASFLASYARARAEGIEVYTTEGIAPRWVRLCLTAVASLALAAAAPTISTAILLFIALLGVLTTISRGAAVAADER